MPRSSPVCQRWKALAALFRTALCATLVAALVGCGDSDDLVGLVRHEDPDFSFMYPDSWELTHDTFELDTPDSRILILRAPGEAVVMLHRFMPPLGWTLREFSKEFSLQRRRRFVRAGNARPKDLRESVISLSPRGNPIRGIRQDFELESSGILSEQSSLFFLIEREDAQIFVSAHAPSKLIPALAADLRTVLGSLQNSSTPKAQPESESPEAKRLESRSTGGPTRDRPATGKVEIRKVDRPARERPAARNSRPRAA